MAKKSAKPAAPAAGESVTIRCSRPGGVAIGPASATGKPTLDLKFGSNEISLAMLEALPESTVKRLEGYVNSGLVTMGVEPPAPKEEPAPAPAAPEPLTLERVKACEDPAELNAWFEAKQAPELEDAIFARLKELDSK